MKKVTRDELYAMVWSRAVQTVAAELGVSDVAVAKWCKKLKVPSPGRGYWQMLKAGRKVKPPPLPEVPEGHPTQWFIDRQASMSKTDPVHDLPADLAGIYRWWVDPANEITPPGRLGKLHPLVAATRAALAESSADDDGLLKPASSCLAVSVGKRSLPRALRIMGGLVKAAERAGLQVSMPETRRHEEPRAAAFLTVCGERVEIELYERVERQEEPLSHREVRALGIQMSTYDLLHRRYYRRPSGELVLCIVDYHHGIQRTWSDGKRARLEERLNQFMKGVVVAAAAGRRERAEREERHRRWEEEERQREEAKRRYREEMARRAALDTAVENWTRSQRIRGFLRALEAVGSRIDDKAHEDPAVAEWLEWAHWYADLIDPLAGSASFWKAEHPRWRAPEHNVADARW